LFNDCHAIRLNRVDARPVRQPIADLHDRFVDDSN